MTKRRRKVPRYKQEIEDAARAEAITRRIPADLSQQKPSNTYEPKLFYEDVPFTCRDCGSQEVWTAEQQKLIDAGRRCCYSLSQYLPPFGLPLTENRYAQILLPRALRSGGGETARAARQRLVRDWS